MEQNLSRASPRVAGATVNLSQGRLPGGSGRQFPRLPDTVHLFLFPALTLPSLIPFPECQAGRGREEPRPSPSYPRGSRQLEEAGMTTEPGTAVRGSTARSRGVRAAPSLRHLQQRGRSWRLAPALPPPGLLPPPELTCPLSQG